MADDTSYGGFTNPGFVTPEQVAQQRQIINQLLGASVAPDTSKHWTGALAQALAGMRAQGMLNNANQGQRQILQQGANAIQGAGQGNPYAGVVTGQNPNPTLPQASNSGGSGDNLPRGIRNNNPGNIKDGPFAQSMPGYAGSDGTFAKFATPDAGAKAMDSLLSTYGNKGINTVSGVVNRWAPPSENNSTAYASIVAKQLGVDPNAPINMGDAAIRQQLAGGITGYENGPRYAPRQQMAQNGGGLANFYMTPGIPQELKDNVLKGNSPVPTEDVYGEPAVRQGVMGSTTGLPTQNFTPGFRAPATVGPDGGVSTTVANPAPGSGVAPTLRNQLGNLYQTGQDFASQSAANTAVRGGVTSDIQSAQAAFPIMQNLDLMANEIDKHGNNMNFGPSAEFMTNMKKVVANHLPNFMSKDELEGLAAQDSVRKMTALLGTAIGRQTGNTDLSLMQGRESVPGEHNSKEGAKAIIDMLKQQVGLNTRFVLENQSNYGKPGFNPLAAKAEFYKQNPIINPLTKNPISVDLQKGEAVAPSFKDYKKLSDEELKKKLGIP